MDKKEKMNDLLAAASNIAAKAEEESRDFTGEERDKVAELLGKARDLKVEIKEAEKDAQMVAEIDALNAQFQKAREETGETGDGAPPAPKGTLGQQFVNAKAYQRWFQNVAPSGHIPQKSQVHSPTIEFKNLLRKDLVTGESDTSAGAFVQTDYTGIYEPLGRHALNVFDLINRRQTTSDLVEFVRQTTRVQEADVVAEANVTTYSGATGEVSGYKPEGKLAFETVQEPVKTIAVWIPATTRALSDASQIRGIIDAELRDDLMEELEDQIINGDGTGENYTGIFNTSGILTQAWDTDLLTTARKAITYLEVTGRAAPTAWVLHPEDWETIELLTDGESRFYWGGPLATGQRRLWGVPVVTSQTLTAGTALMGDFRKAVLWDRQQASIQVSNSHADFFIRNMIAILAEMRAAFGVIRPSAFVEVALETGT